jgi:beta-lactamase regulating signal transducer with metallopeptidase domain
MISTIAIMTISGGLLALLLILAKPVMRHRLPKSAQYYLWLVVLAAFLVPISKIITLPMAATVPLAPVHSAVNVLERGFAERSIPQLTTAQPPSLPVAPAANVSDLQFQIYPVNTNTHEATPPVNLTAIITVAYVFIAIGILFYSIVSYTLFNAKLKARHIPPRAGETAILKSLSGRFLPRLYRNKLIATPMLTGVFRPAIILPDREYTDTQLRVILTHEMVHLKRFDVLVKWLSLLACAVHWFNPVVWVSRKEIALACELSCDERVIHDMDNRGKQNYGDILISVAAECKTPVTILATTMSEEKKVLKERLTAIMKSKKQTKTAVFISIIVIITAVLAACGLGAGGSAAGTRDSVDGIGTSGPQNSNNNSNSSNQSASGFANISIAPINGESLSQFTEFYEFDYLAAYNAHHGTDLSLPVLDRIIITTDTPIFDFSLIEVFYDFETMVNGVIVHAAHTWHTVERLTPEKPLIINNFFTAGMIPNNGISFRDDFARHIRHFSIEAPYGHEDAVYTLVEFINGEALFVWEMPWFEAAELFLSDFWSLWGVDWVGGNNPSARVLYDWGTDGAGRVYYDRQGNIVANDAIFLLGEAPWQMVAWDFTVVELHDAGLPAVLVRFVYPESGGGFPYVVYNFEGGSFYPVTQLISPTFYSDGEGIIVIESNYDDMQISRLLTSWETEIIAPWSEPFDVRSLRITQIEPRHDLHTGLSQGIGLPVR